jgi:hypothetical protein
MAVAIQLDFAGATREQYDAVVKEMGLSSGGPTPPGALFHWMSLTADGFRVVDVWETQEAFDHFAQTQIGPLSAKAGMTTPPVIQTFDVYSYFIAKG